MSIQADYEGMIHTICLSEKYPRDYFTEANDIIVEMAMAGHDPSLLVEILYQITEGYKSIGRKSAIERFHNILGAQNGILSSVVSHRNSGHRS